MLNRRHLRIKVLQALYAFLQSNNSDLIAAEKELFKNIEQIHDLYLYFLLSFEDIVAIENARLEELKNKRFATEEDKHPNRKFVENSIFSILTDNASLKSYSEARKVNWVGAEEQEMLKKVLGTIRESETYVLYMANEERSFQEDTDFTIAIFKECIANSPLLYGYFEDMNIHWIDDIDLACSMVLKTIKTFREGEIGVVLPLYKDEEDEKSFVSRLFRQSVAQYNDNKTIIDGLISNWELDRLAIMDILLMNLAITELKEFSNIPVKVSLNEYIEISKFYSTPKSNGFINGVLDKAVEKLQKEKAFIKAGRGLMN